jgi:hypothetical protein
VESVAAAADPPNAEINANGVAGGQPAACASFICSRQVSEKMGGVFIQYNNVLMDYLSNTCTRTVRAHAQSADWCPTEEVEGKRE